MNPGRDKSTRRSAPDDAPNARFVPFAVEFAKFFTGFAVIIAAALFALHIASAAMS